MCGRYTLDTSWAEVHAFLQPISFTLPAVPLLPAYNIAPSQPAWMLRLGEDGALAEALRWGLRPAWAQPGVHSYSTINARAESMATKPSFREAFAHRRGLVPASGYYEWQARSGRRQPFYVHPLGAPLFAMAALWEPAHPGADQGSFSIVTVAANASLVPLHDRMPLLLDAEQAWRWMSGTREQAAALATIAPQAPLAWHAVDPAVGNVRNQGPQLCAPAAVDDLFG